MKKHSKRRPPGQLPMYTLMHELTASPTEPVAKHLLAEHLGKVRAALAALQMNPDPTTHDWGALSDAVNLASSLVELGLISDESGEVTKAKDAMGEAGARLLAGGTLRLTGPGIQVLHALLDDYEEVVHALAARQFIRGVRHAERRVLELLRGKRYAGDRVVAP